jgi:hypothetical protein
MRNVKERSRLWESHLNAEKKRKMGTAEIFTVFCIAVGMILAGKTSDQAWDALFRGFPFIGS